MIKKILCTLTAIISMLAVCTGCSSKQSNTTVIENSASVQNDIHINDKLDLELMAENVEQKYKSEEYALNDISIEIPTKENNFFNVIIVAEERPADPSFYVELCQSCLLDLNAEAIKQDPEYKPSSEDYYGGLFDQYTVVLTATCYDDLFKKWPVYQTINSGKHDTIVTNDDDIDILDF